MVQSVTGTAEVLDDAGQWRRVRRGDNIREGLTVRTGAGSRVDLKLVPYGGVLTLHPESTVTFERIGRRTGTEDAAAILDLTRGRITGDTLVLPSGTKIFVKTLGGVHEIR